jgi:hypothetical protein
MNARWSLDSGRTVEFRLIETAATENSVNPFKEYVKRRNGHVGQRFWSAIVPVGSEQPVYDGELMLCDWGDTARGKTVKFWLDNEASLHPFAGYRRRIGKETGSLFMGALTELSDEGDAVDQGQRDVAEGKPRRLSSSVHLMITSPLFCQFMTERSQRTASIHRRGLTWSSAHPKTGEMMTKAYVKAFLKIDSLSDLDRDPHKAEQFHKTFRRPFARWSGGEHR